MKKIKYIIPLVILFIAIGFAAISYTFNLDGNAGLAGDLDNFNVYYSNTYVNGVEDYSVITSPTELDFTTTLKEPGTTYSITYDVTNGSKHFDAELTMTCTNGDSYISVTNNFDTSTNLEALGTRSGTITLKKLHSIASFENTTKTVSCTITATPVERTSLGEGTAIDKQYAVLKATSKTDTTMFRSETYKQNIKTITLQDTINVSEAAIESWDIGVAQNGNVMAYVVTNPDDAAMYDLYIQANGKIYANRDMSYWFYDFQNLDAINNLNLLDTSSAVNMTGVFSQTGYKSKIFTLDLSNFDTSNVTNMSGMFNKVAYENPDFTLDVSNLDTSKVTEMAGMFQAVGYNNSNFILDLSNFDTSNVTDMSYMFNKTGYNSTAFTLDLSNFDTSKVTNMYGMFAQVGCNNPNFTLDISNFDTNNVENMSHMFNSTGKTSTVFILDLSNFDTSKVTNMESMFSTTGYTNPDFTIKLSDKFDTSKVTNMRYMFFKTGYNSTKLNISIDIRNPNVENYEEMFYHVTQQTGAKITVNYTSETEELVDAMIASKVESPNVVKGILVS